MRFKMAPIRLLVVILIVGLPHLIFAQDYEMQKDSLLKELSLTENVKDRCEILKDLTILCRSISPKEAIPYGQKLIREAEKLPNSKTLASSYVLYGHLLFLNGHEMDSIKLLSDESLRISNLLDYDIGKLSSYYLSGLYERGRGSVEIAAQYFLDAIELGEQSRDAEHKLIAAKSTQGLGVLKDNQGKHDESKVLFLKALRLGEDLDNDELRFHSKQSLGISEALNGEMREGLRHFLEAKPFANNVSEETLILSNISLAYTYLGVIDSAEMYSVEAVRMSREIGNVRQQVVTLSSLAEFYAQQNMNEKWLETLNKRKPLVEELNSKKWTRSSHLSFSNYYEAMGDAPEALLHYKLFKSSNDSLINERTEESIVEMEKKYESEKSKRLIKEQELELTKQSEQRKLLLVSFLLLSLLAVLVFWFMRKRNLKNNTIAEQRAELDRQEIKQLQKEKEILGMASMLKGQESERSRIASDLHDGLGGLLSSVKAHFSMVGGEIEKIESVNMYNNALAMMDNACEEVRRISHNLMPPLLHSQGLHVAVSNLVNNTNISHKMNIHFEERTYEGALDETKSIFIYRICQELINNIVKHAETTEVEISLYSLQDTIQLIVEDQGKGFDIDEIKYGIGLHSIRSRVDYLKGEMEIDSVLGKGTMISVIIPR